MSARYPPYGMLGPDAIARWALATRAASVAVDGAAHVPRRGGALIVARHVHHLLDGAVLLRRVPRPVHLVVALDWAAAGLQRRVMARACALAQWPVVFRGDGLASRGGLRDAAALLAAGRVVAIFPEGYPAIDPAARAPRPRDADGFLPFAPGYRALLRRAPVPVVPLGFAYRRDGERWHVVARFGAPLAPDAAPDAVEAAVRALSR